MNINARRYFDSTGLKGWSKRYNRFPKNKFGKMIFQITEGFRHWLIIGFKYIKDDTVKGGRTWNDNYHLLSKLCRYETWDDIKITWWDKIRYRIVTGYKFE